MVIGFDRDGETGTAVERPEADGCRECVAVVNPVRVDHGDSPRADGEQDGAGAIDHLETVNEASSGHAEPTVTSPAMPFATRHAPHGMVAAVDHLASSAGVGMLQQGGRAADAAVAASAVGAVTGPAKWGMGGGRLRRRQHGDGPPTASE